MDAYHGCISDFLKRKSEAFDPAPCNKAAFFFFILYIFQMVKKFGWRSYLVKGQLISEWCFGAISGQKSTESVE